MQPKPMQRLLVAAAIAAAMLPATAAELAGAAPLAVPDGIQSDASTVPWVQPFNVAASGTLESIVWWGFHGGNSGGPTSDSFVVLLGGSQQDGTLSITDAGAGVSRYELDVADAALAAGTSTLEITNNSFDVEWFWQCSTANCLDNGSVAFSLVGTLNGGGGGDVPEPATYALMLLGAVAARAAAQRRKAA